MSILRHTIWIIRRLNGFHHGNPTTIPTPLLRHRTHSLSNRPQRIFRLSFHSPTPSPRAAIHSSLERMMVETVLGEYGRTHKVRKAESHLVVTHRTEEPQSLKPERMSSFSGQHAVEAEISINMLSGKSFLPSFCLPRFECGARTAREYRYLNVSLHELRHALSSSDLADTAIRPYANSPSHDICNSAPSFRFRLDSLTVAWSVCFIAPAICHAVPTIWDHPRTCIYASPFSETS